MELWFSDYQTEAVKVSVKVEKQLFGEQTDCQNIDVFESKEFGRFL
ncbi:MAG: spermidine synthase, partial [Clostridiales bacterium]|nr:spermidine synthase [Clostridiales bacterium]